MISPPFLSALTPLGDRVLVWASLVASLACFGAAVAATYRASRSAGDGRHGHWALAAAVAFLGGLAYFQVTADQPTAIPIAGLALVLVGTIGLLVATNTLPSRR
jgi:hypothetical protein